MVKHTPGPWGFGNTSEDQKLILGDNGNGRYVCSIQIWQTPRRMGLMSEEERESNASFIVHACNCHDELVETLKELFDFANPYLKVNPGYAGANIKLSEKVQQVLAKATQREA